LRPVAQGERILSTDSRVIPTLPQEPAPGLPALHKAFEEAGDLGNGTLAPLAESLGVPLADLVSAATFYHYFSPDLADTDETAMCGGPVCSLTGAPRQGEHAIACPGLCDHPPAQHRSGVFTASGAPKAHFEAPVPTPGERAIFPGDGFTSTETLDEYRKASGYEELLRLAHGGDLDAALETVAASGLVGRGGAAFPVGVKWRAVRDAAGDEKVVVCNADEGEPGTFKDRAILHLRPHLLLEAMAISGLLVGARTGVIYLRYEYPQAFEVLTEAIREAEKAGLLGASIDGTDFGFAVHIRRGAGSYVCGEETALLNSLEGKRPWPRERPPYPTTHGLWGLPTVINNVETLSTVPAILRNGADWYQALGVGESAGTKLYSLSGKVNRPGNYELPLGTTARQLIFDYGGGLAEGRHIKAFTLGGISGGLLGEAELDMPLDYKAPQKLGAFLGSGGVVVLDDTCCVVDFARTCLAFYEEESCGKCFPCRIGTVRLREFLDAATGRAESTGVGEADLKDISEAMAHLSACGLGQSAPMPLQALWTRFADELEEHVNQHTCRAGVCSL
jgi:NADH:ubiquinone oxidoreductase subunit F (NADH-binding)